MNVIENGNYVYEDGYYKSVFWIYIPYGRGIDVDTKSIMAIKRVAQIEKCDISFPIKSKNITHEQLIDYTKKHDKKALASDNLNENGDSDSLRETIKKYFPFHWYAYGSLKSDPNSTAVIFQMFYVVKSETLEALKEQIELTIEYYRKGENKNFTQYIELVPMLNKEYETLEGIYNKDLSTIYPEFDTNLQFGYSGIDFFESGVLQDENGTPLGSDIYSSKVREGGTIKQSKVLIDYNKSFDEKMLIAIPRDMSSFSYTYKNKETNNIVPTSSIVSQSIANQLILCSDKKEKRNYRVAHCVLNGYDYREVKNAELYFNNERLFYHVDMGNIAINPNQPTGNRNEQDKLYTSFKKKIPTMLNIAYDYNLSDIDLIIIEEAFQVILDRWWGENDLDKKLIGQDNEIFPEIADIIEALELKKQNYIEHHLGKKVERVDTIKTIVETVIRERRNLIGRRTTFVPPKSYQVFYDFSNISTLNLRILQFVNAINTIVSEYEKGDCIIIHGADLIPPQVIEQYLHYELEDRLKDKGIRLIYSMDSFLSGKGHKITEYKEVIYSNFDNDFELIIHGYTPFEHIETLKKLYGRTFNEQVIADITFDGVKARSIARRKKTLSLALVDIRGGIV